MNVSVSTSASVFATPLPLHECGNAVRAGRDRVCDAPPYLHGSGDCCYHFFFVGCRACEPRRMYQNRYDSILEDSWGVCLQDARLPTIGTSVWVNGVLNCGQRVRYSQAAVLLVVARSALETNFYATEARSAQIDTTLGKGHYLPKRCSQSVGVLDE